MTEQAALFADGEKDDAHAPLAERMRPRSLDEFLGQRELVGPDGPLRRLIEADSSVSMIFWGPPGCGKTTLARIVAATTGRRFESLSAVTAGLAEVRRIIAAARARGRGKTVLFVDEIHRFNKAQQDAFLPHVEDGTVIMMGATTENPSFEVIAPLLSRCKVFVLSRLEREDLLEILRRALSDERGLAGRFSLSEAAADFVADWADGDARRALNLLEAGSEVAARLGSDEIDLKTLEAVAQRRALAHDRSGDSRYDLISALHKSLRGSDVDASLYWLARLLEAGEDPLYVARRLVRAAAEDVGLADPMALVVAASAYQAAHLVGMPEADCILAEAVIYLAAAPKSNAAYTAYGAAAKAVAESGQLPVPLHIRNAPTRLMRRLGYAEGYKYPHSFPQHIVAQRYLPDELGNPVFYRPTEQGREARTAERVRRNRELLRRRAPRGGQGDEDA